MSSLSEKNINDNISDDKVSKYKSKEYKDLKKIALNNIHKRYGPKAKLKYKYLGLITENLIFNKNTHLVTVFKDYMIWDYIEEFLKRYYNGYESVDRVPKFASFYKNYLKFFCIPTFRDIFCNEMIHNYSEKKAEMFYNANYRKKKEESEQKDFGLFEESESDEESDSKISKNIEKTIFDETIKKRIERYSPINTSMVLPESDAKLKTDDSGLLVTSSNEESLVDIMKGMTPPIKNKSKKSKKYEIINNKNNNINNNNIKNNNYVNNSLNNKSTNNENNISNVNKNKNSSNNNINPNNNNGQGENSSSYRLSQKNLLSSTLNKLNSQTIETLLNSQMKKRNISSKLPNTNKNTNIHIKDNLNNHNNNNKNNNGLFKNQFYNNRNNDIISYMGIYKKKSIPKSRNENKLPEKEIKSQTKLNNFMININNNNNAGTITNMKQNQNNNLKNITSIGNYNFNYKQGLQKSRNQQQSISINSNTYTKNSFDKINNIKKNINLNLIKNKNNNVEFILNQLKAHPFFTLKKNSTKKSSYNSSNNNRKFDDKKMAKNSKILSADYDRNQGLLKGQMEYDRYSTKIRSMNNNSNKNKDIRPYSHKYNNSPSVLEFMKKAAIKSMKSNITLKSSNSKDIKYYKQPSRNFSNNESQKSNHEQKNKNKKIKMSFDGIMNKNLKKGYNNKKTIINNNGSKHIHNVNININNQINIGGKQFNEIFSFSNLVKKNTNSNHINNNIYALLKNNNKNTNYLSRNKNQSLDFNSYINNTNNINLIGNNKMNSITDFQNGSNKSIFKTQNKINNNGHSGTIINNKNKETKKIRLTNNTLFRSMKIINNKFGKNHF